MTNYQIIAEEDTLKNFIDWLPELKEDEIYYVCLFSRKKYDPNKSGIGRDKDQLKRFTSRKQDLMKKIRQLEIEVGRYMHKDGSAVSQESIALYITVNPRSQTKAAKSLLIDLANKVTQDYDGYNVHHLALSNIHKSKSRTVWIDFDFDYSSCETEWSKMVEERPQLQEPPFKDMSLRQRYELYIKGKVFEYLLLDRGLMFSYKHIVQFLITRGGLHVLVNPEEVGGRFKKSFYKNIFDLIGCDQSVDNMIPVPGCIQGGFIPKFWS